MEGRWAGAAKPSVSTERLRPSHPGGNPNPGGYDVSRHREQSCVAYQTSMLDDAADVFLPLLLRRFSCCGVSCPGVEPRPPAASSVSTSSMITRCSSSRWMRAVSA